MVVRVLPRAQARPASQARASLPPVVLALALVPAALDLLKIVQPGLVPALTDPTAVASGAAAGVLLAMWLRFPRTTWLAAAGFAALASLAMRVVDADIAPALCLLSILALGLGGAFRSDPEFSQNQNRIQADAGVG